MRFMCFTGQKTALSTYVSMLRGKAWQHGYFFTLFSYYQRLCMHLENWVWLPFYLFIGAL